MTDNSKYPTAREMVRQYLIDHGFDGLCSDDAECACEVGDLAPCGEMYDTCWAGYKRPCDCGEGCDFHIGGKSSPDADHVAPQPDAKPEPPRPGTLCSCPPTAPEHELECLYHPRHAQQPQEEPDNE